MANLVLTPASVLPSANAVTVPGIFGAAFTQGQIGYLDPVSSTWLLASAAAAIPVGALVGIALNAGSIGQPARFAVSDAAFTHGLAGVTVGEVIVLSATAGALAPVADLASGDFPCVVMIAISATQAVLAPISGPAAIP